MIPNAHDGYYHVDYSDEQVEAKQEEIAVIFETHTVVDPCYTTKKYTWKFDELTTVMIHVEDAGSANATVVSSRRLDIVALLTFFGPNTLKLRHGFSSIFYEAFDIFLQSLEAVILFLFLGRFILVTFSLDFNALTMSSLFVTFFAELFHLS